ncbi:hypothetical protein L1987_47707 [Smallanthus sonchifolius]|uniref:Uncharacterized protein n=1 Tax=Smallanthus sonchifolius TaxID=185202 RepID=A0ACB9G3A8_9ASTR|nr:hypothetical protein L1987_47707 [Smallanthus sonchifolius]
MENPCCVWVLIGRAIEKCLVEWGLKNVLTVTVDNASSNDVVIKYLQKVFNHWECGVLKGEFFAYEMCGSYFELGC